MHDSTVSPMLRMINRFTWTFCAKRGCSKCPKRKVERFWIDGDETHKVPGTLTYGSGITCTLELSGQLEDWSRNAEMQTILGLVDGGMQCVTLRDCFALSASGFRGMPGATQKYICHQVFKGKVMFIGGEQIDAEGVDCFDVAIGGMVEWEQFSRI